MTNTIRESHLEGMLKRLRETSELELSIDHNASGYTLYLMESKGKILEMLGFSVSKSGIYQQMLCACRVIAAMQQQHDINKHYGPGLIDNR